MRQARIAVLRLALDGHPLPGSRAGIHLEHAPPGASDQLEGAVLVASREASLYLEVAHEGPDATVVVAIDAVPAVGCSRAKRRPEVLLQVREHTCPTLAGSHPECNREPVRVLRNVVAVG